MKEGGKRKMKEGDRRKKSKMREGEKGKEKRERGRERKRKEERGKGGVFKKKTYERELRQDHQDSSKYEGI